MSRFSSIFRQKAKINPETVEISRFRDFWYYSHSIVPEFFFGSFGVMSQRSLFVNAATAFIKAGEYDRAKEMLDKCQQVVKRENFPLESIPLGFSGNDYMVCEMVAQYYTVGEVEKARELAASLFNELLVSSRFYMEFYDYCKSDFELCGNYVYYLQDVVEKAGDGELAKKIGDNFEQLIGYIQGDGAKSPESETISAD